MAQPSERERDREKDRYRSSSHHHHHRTISSTTLLLALSLILAVLAITLTIPSYSSSTPAEPAGGLLGYLTPKRAQGLLAREQAVAMREAEVARREAEFLVGSPAGVGVPPPAGITPIPNALPNACPPGTLSIVTQTVTLESYPIPTVVKEVVKEIDAPSTVVRYADPRVENLFEREHRVSDRERDVSGREEVVGKREVDAARREQWIMDQLIKLGNDKIVEEEVVYDTPRKKKESPPLVKPKKETYHQDSFQDSFHPDSYPRESFHPDSYARESFHPDSYPRDSFPREQQPREQYPHDPPEPLQPIHEPSQPFEEAPQPFRVSVADDPSETRLAAPPKPIVMMENKKPYVGKTQAYEVVVDQTPTGPAIPEPTFKAQPYVHVTAHAQPQAKGQTQPQPQHDDNDNDDDEERPVKTIRRTKIPGRKHPTWGW